MKKHLISLPEKGHFLLLREQDGHTEWLAYLTTKHLYVSPQSCLKITDLPHLQKRALVYVSAEMLQRVKSVTACHEKLDIWTIREARDVVMERLKTKHVNQKIGSLRRRMPHMVRADGTVIAQSDPDWDEARRRGREARQAKRIEARRIEAKRRAAARAETRDSLSQAGRPAP